MVLVSVSLLSLHYNFILLLFDHMVASFRDPQRVEVEDLAVLAYHKNRYHILQNLLLFLLLTLSLFL